MYGSTQMRHCQLSMFASVAIMPAKLELSAAWASTPWSLLLQVDTSSVTWAGSCPGRLQHQGSATWTPLCASRKAGCGKRRIPFAPVHESLAPEVVQHGLSARDIEDRADIAGWGVWQGNQRWKMDGLPSQWLFA